MSLDTAIWLAIVAVEIALLAMLAVKRVYRGLPVFCIYILWVVISDLAMMIVKRQFPSAYFQAFLIEMPLDACLQFCVLVELTRSVLRPLRNSFSRKITPALAGVILLAGAALWPVAGTVVLPGYSPQWHLLFQLQQTFSILRVLVFLLLAGLSQVLAIGWRDRELQIATGLGFYSLVSLGAAALHNRPASPPLYHRIDQIVMASYLLSLAYWIVSFAQKEAPRQEFSPKMQSILLSVAGAAQASRIAAEDLRKTKR